ncbi:carbohydrate ABC transporter permease [Isoptericola sp. NPDC019693]|uniref:carbohydrate ABC transporter permease n=1 Tax=Isoptericola sp. NPDC019693 TaxID=3364009 RepID=UPI0037901BB2
MTTTLAGPAPVVAPGPGAERRRSRARVRERTAQWLFLVPAIAYVLVFFGYPIVKNLVMGSQDYTVRTFVSGEAPWVGLDNYAEVVTSSLFRTTVLNTALFTVGSIVGQFVIGLLFALFFKRRFPLGNVLRSLLLLPWLLPMIAGTAVWKWILDQDGGVLNETLRAIGIIDAPIHWLTSPDIALVAVVLVNVWVGIPFNMTLLYSGLQNIPDELYEAGALDGATGAKAFWHITWPNLRPVVSVVLVLGVIYTLKVLDIILGLTGGGPANATQTLATDSYRRSFQEFSFGTGAAVSNILIVVSLLFAVVYLRVNKRAVDE